MMELAFRLSMAFNATSLMVIVFFAKNSYTAGYFFPQSPFLVALPNGISYALYVFVPILLTGLLLFLCAMRGKDAFQESTVASVEQINGHFLPGYLDCLFIALVAGDWEMFALAYWLLFTAAYLSMGLCFIPFFLIFRFSLYRLTTTNGAVVFLMSRQKLKAPSDITIPVAYRINNYAFIHFD